MIDCDAVLFDCDGVLVDSEPITNGVLREMLAELGWSLEPQECMRLFLGKAVRDEADRIERHTGFRVNDDWLVGFRARRDVALRAGVKPIAHAVGVSATLHDRLGGRIAVASGADRAKVEMQLQLCGLAPYFEGRVFSGHEMTRSKPAPDVYLAAAAALGVAPGRCVVVEDSVVGATAGVSAGAFVIGFSPGGSGHSDAQALTAAGAGLIIADLRDIPALLGLSTAPT